MSKITVKELFEDINRELLENGKTDASRVKIKLASSPTTEWSILSIYFAPEDGKIWIDIEANEQ